MIELVVTMIVIGIMAILVLPRFDSVGVFDAAGFGDQVQAILRYAQKTAIAQRRNVSVSVATNAASLCSYTGAPTPCNASCSGAVLSPPGGSFRPASTATMAATTLCFDATGKPYQGAAALGGTLSIVISEGGSSVKTIVVEPETGYVH